MLKTVAVSSNAKTGPIAVTYRAGSRETFGTCPKSCALHPSPDKGTDAVDAEYLDALLDAVPVGGKSWTYSHFDDHLIPAPAPGRTVINASCDTVADAVRVTKSGKPAVFAAPKDSADSWPQVIDGVRFVRCPAEVSDAFTCRDCGRGDPLCARGNRDFVVVFVGHGSQASKVGADVPGGCYAAQGRVVIQWHGTRKNGQADDARVLRSFAKSLPYGSFLRHHVAGDIGMESPCC